MLSLLKPTWSLFLKSFQLAAVVFILLTLICPAPGWAKPKRIGHALCNEKGYQCITVKKGDSWESLWTKEDERMFVKRINRLNLRLRPGMTLAVPKKFNKRTIKKATPFPKSIGTPNEKIILVDLTQLAWGAYDSKGKLVRWGPASGGKNWCPDVGRSCRTPAKEFAIKRKIGRRCKSRKFPIGKGGAPMPYCMFFYGGYAIHGSNKVPGYNASHGCVRTFKEDAKWLNEEFVELPDKKNELPGTKIIILPYSNRVATNLR